MTKRCEGCGHPFQSYPSKGQRFCSRRCGNWLHRCPEHAVNLGRRSGEARGQRKRHPEYIRGYHAAWMQGKRAGRRELAAEWTARLRLEHPQLLKFLTAKQMRAKQEHAA